VTALGRDEEGCNRRSLAHLARCIACERGRNPYAPGGQLERVLVHVVERERGDRRARPLDGRGDGICRGAVGADHERRGDVRVARDAHELRAMHVVVVSVLPSPIR